MGCKLNKESRTIIELMIADGIISREDAEKYFPELKSKDRRIRTEIINFLNTINKDTLEGRSLIADRYGDAIPDDMVPTWIDWLEKQGVKFGVGDTIRLKGSLAEYTITSISDGAYHGNGWSIGFDCEDDYEFVKVAGLILPISIQKMVDDYANNPEKGNEEFGLPVNCMVRAYKQGVEDTLEIGGVQKPTEWSEEDETIKHDIECLITFALKKGSAVAPGVKTTKEEALNWLRSLSPQNRWQPSEEQMNALKNAAKHFGGCDPDDWDATLESLYNDLKNLM